MLNRERKKRNQIRCDYYVPSWFSHFCHEHLWTQENRKSMVADGVEQKIVVVFVILARTKS